MMIFLKVYVWNLCVLVFFSKSIRSRFIRFTHFFENVFGLGYSFFQTNKVKVIRFSKNVYIYEKRLKKTYESIRCPFFPDVLLKNRCSHTQLILKIRLFFKEQTALKSMFCQKKRSFCQKHFAMSFFSSFL